MRTAQRFRRSRPYRPTRWNAGRPLITPTYDGSGQTVHPDVLRVPGGWNGWEYWMGVTPYPNTNDDFENPSILVSADGTNWQVPAGLTNPIEPWPGGVAHHADPDIVLGPGNVTMYCYYLHSGDMAVKSSTDGITWTAQVAPWTDANLAVSPAVLLDGSTWRAWYVQPDITPALRYRISSSPTSGWSAAQGCTVTGVPGGRIPWHIDVLKHSGKFYALLNLCDSGGSGINALLHLASSTDGINWTCGPVILGLVPNCWDSAVTYRGSMLVAANGTDFDVWYSARSTGGQWRTGRTRIPISEAPAPP